jgi:curved DNA-binding protein CbpA
LSTSRPRPRFDTSINYYQVLDVPLGATREEITRAYRGLMRLTHPDNFRDPDQRAKAEERTKLINAAYNVLSKPEIRSEYDAQMRATMVADSLMQRYTGNTPGRPSPQQAHRRHPTASAARAQRTANRSATLQILIVAAAFVAALFIIFATIFLSLELVNWLI